MKRTLWRMGLIVAALRMLSGCQGTIVDLEDTLYRNVTELDDILQYTESRQPCADRNIHRNLYFGDLHAHTALSFDAVSYHVRTTSDDAYAFARGESVRLPPLSSDGTGTREVTIAAPLDFVALTDHQEFLAEVRLCMKPGHPAYDADICRRLRDGGDVVARDFGIQLARTNPNRIEDICGPEGDDCIRLAADIWEEIVTSADRNYDTSSACTFTTFPAYEYTSTMPAMANHHRNVIFRNAHVPALPPSYFEAPSKEALWSELDALCVLSDGPCDVIVIPHNSNWSNGNMFIPDYLDLTVDAQLSLLELRARMEVLIEVFQHKGDMEAANGFADVSPDRLADFEKIREADAPDCGDTPGSGGVAGIGCVSRYDFVRNILKLGMREHARIGINPYRFGIIGSTDTHNGTPGHVTEWNFEGHVGTADDTVAKRFGPPTSTHNVQVYNPGGLAAVWAVENSRDALFEAFRRREVYSTSGPRIGVRFFGGYVYPQDMCHRADLVTLGYDRGVPMGGVLPPRRLQNTAPMFTVTAQRAADLPDMPGAPLQKIQIIKGWVDASGREQETIYHVAGDPDQKSRIDPDTCETSGLGFDHLCATWADPDFNPSVYAFYYARVVEVPTCSWRRYDCNRMSADDPGRPGQCDSSDTEMIIEERAVTSPIWYIP